MDKTNVKEEEARKVMQKAYITFSTAEDAADTKFPDIVWDLSKTNCNYMNQFARGKFYKDIFVDPRSSKEPVGCHKEI